MGKIVNTEKIYIGVPAKTFRALRRDAELFEVFKDNGTEINMNRFLSLLLIGYYGRYKQERNEKADKIKEMIGPWLRLPKNLDGIVDTVMEEVVLPEVPKRKGKNPERLSLKPTRETDRIITEIKETASPYTEYLCRMLISYCEKPIHERERIIFLDNAEFIKDACRKKKEITFSTVNDPKYIHHVIAYDFVIGSEEMNNYLLCQEYINDRQRYEPVSYRLCRITGLGYSEKSATLEENVIRYLEMMKKRGPQYAITEEKEICVRLSPKGQRSYRKIYFARPVVDRIEMLENGSALYYFSDAPDLVFRFVIRFGAGEAEIMSPPELREKAHKHFRESLIPYENE